MTKVLGINPPASHLMNWFKISIFFQLFAIATLNFLPIYWKNVVGYSEPEIGYLNGISTTVSVIGPFVFGWFSRFRTERVIAFCFIGIAVLAPGLLWLWGFYLQSATYALILVLKCGFLTLVPVGVLQIIKRSAGGLEYAQYRRWGSLGFLLGSLLSGKLAQAHDIRIVVGLLAVCALLAGLPFALRIQLPKIEFKGSYGAVWGNKGVRWFLLALIGWSLCHGAVFLFLPLRIQELGGSSDFVGLVFSVFGIAAVVSLGWMGRLVDKGNLFALFAWSTVFMGLRILLLGLAQNHWVVLAITLLHIPSWVMYDVCIIKFSRNYCPKEHYAKLQALIQVCTYAGFAVSDYIYAYFIGVGGLAWSYSVLSWLPLLGIPAIYFSYNLLVNQGLHISGNSD
jgi:MFS transporter, PPP family, 3-phenylpropionic acid transporter